MLCSLTFLTACATVEERLEVAAKQMGQTNASRHLPDYPRDCRGKEKSGVRVGEPLDVALIRTDRALGRANARLQRCGQWYDEIKSGFRAGKL